MAQRLSGCDFHIIAHLPVGEPARASGSLRHLLAVCHRAMNWRVARGQQASAQSRAASLADVWTGLGPWPNYREWKGSQEAFVRWHHGQTMPAFSFPVACVGRRPEGGREHVPLQSGAAWSATQDGALCVEPGAPRRPDVSSGTLGLHRALGQASCPSSLCPMTPPSSSSTPWLLAVSGGTFWGVLLLETLSFILDCLQAPF